ncbi:hypothetical protein M0R45_034138 [Rubus argutus]|uniref:Uncharacterized protein n=1 Tax=Rubus argutus TaxID=59490 RepID=A0AAW1VUT4_RUBAR
MEPSPNSMISSLDTIVDQRPNNLEIKRHEDNIKFLQTEINRLSQSILKLQVSLANHHSGNGNGTTDENGATRALNLALTKDALGIIGSVASLGRVDDDNLSRLLSEYLGLETMLGIGSAGIHGLGFFYWEQYKMALSVICLEDLSHMLMGGMIKECGVFALGSRKVMDVKFLATSGESSLPENYIETEDILKKLKLERTHVTEDMQREQELLDLAKITSARFCNFVFKQMDAAKMEKSEDWI